MLWTYFNYWYIVNSNMCKLTFTPQIARYMRPTWGHLNGGWTNCRTWEMCRINREKERRNSEQIRAQSAIGRAWRSFLLPSWHICVKRVVPLNNTIPQYMYSSNIIDMPHVFSPRFVTQIFVAGKKLLLRSILCVFIRLYEFTTDFLLWIARPLWFLVASYHDMTVILMYNEIQSQRGQQSILVFLWRLTSENVNA